MLGKLLNRHSGHQLRVLFVCTANICRSPLAEAILRERAKAYQDRFLIKVDSCGVEAGPVPMPPDMRARNVAQQRGVSLKGIKSRRLSEQDYFKYDVILAMDSKHLAALDESKPDSSTARIELFRQQFETDQEVPDPYYGNSHGFERVFKLLLEATDHFLDETESHFEQLNTHC